MDIWKAIQDERRRQDAKWGRPSHSSQYWLVILIEEVGEIAQAILQRKLDEYVTALIQAAAVIVAMLEAEGWEPSSQ